jgi:6-phosphogluconate dehydrogenase
MQLGMIGLGRMGANMVRRLLPQGHQCVVYDRNQDKVEALVKEGATGAASLGEFAEKLRAPRAAWLMVPAAVVDDTLRELVLHLTQDDLVVDGGNSHYADDLRREVELRAHRVHYIDVGVSGGVRGLERGYCLMIGGESTAVRRLEPIFRTLAPGRDSAPRLSTGDGSSTAEEGFLYCGPAGAGHFVKMVHNSIEYGLMAAYAEGFDILRHANVGAREHAADAETTPLRDPERYRYDFNVAEIAEVWRRGSVVASWLLDLTAIALRKDPALSGFSGRVADSGEGRWAVQAAIDTGAPTPVLSAALYERFSSRGEGEFTAKLLSAMRFEFGGHEEKK